MLRHTFAILNYYRVTDINNLKANMCGQILRFCQQEREREKEREKIRSRNWTCSFHTNLLSPIGTRAVKWSKRSYARRLGTGKKTSRASEETIQTGSNWPRQTRDREVRELFLGERKHDSARLDWNWSPGVYLTKFNGERYECKSNGERF